MKSLLLLYAIISVTRGQENGNFTAIINSTSNAPNATFVSNLERQITEKCTCVPFYLCDNGYNGERLYVIRYDTFQSSNCDHYLMVCCPEDKRHDQDQPVTAVVNKTIRPAKCGVRNPEGVGFHIPSDTQNYAQFGEFPWTTAVLKEERLEDRQENRLVYTCGGSLIHPKVVLTGAHCVVDKEKKYKVRVGEWDTQTKNEIFPHQNKDVGTIITHPDYSKTTLFNDIALLILDEAVSLGPNIDTICLPPQDQVMELDKCFTTGWGKDVFEREGKYSVVLKKVELKIVPRDVCEANLRETRLGSQFKLHKSFLCAGEEDETNTCSGDGGSPLVCPIPESPGRYYQAGIFSWAIWCGQQDVPRVYANVALFIDWINAELSSYGIDNTYYIY